MVHWVTENFLAILSALHPRYIDSKGSDRKAVISDGVQEITASAEKDGVAIPPSLRKVRSLCIKHIFTLMPILLQKVTVWFQNAHQRRQEGNAKTSRATSDRRDATTWTVRKLVKEQKEDELNALILKEDSSAHPGTKSYLKHVQKCLTVLVDALSKTETTEFEGVVAERNIAGVDSALKAK